MNLSDILRRLRNSEGGSRSAPARQLEYHAVAVVADADACQAARAIRGKRVLSRDAPPMPLPACTKPETCNCKFAKFNDRRQEERRDILSFSRWYPGTERRTSMGRRSTDR